MAVTQEVRNARAYEDLRSLALGKEGVKSGVGISVQVSIERAPEGEAYRSVNGPHIEQLLVQIYRGRYQPGNFAQGFRFERGTGVVGEFSIDEPLIKPTIRRGDLSDPMRARRRRVDEVATFIRTALEHAV